MSFDELEGSEYIDDFYVEAETFYNNMEYITVFSALSFLYPMMIYLEFVFSKKTGRQFELYTVRNFLDLSIAIVFMVQFVFQVGSFNSGISHLGGRDLYKAYFINVFSTVHEETISWLMAIAAGTLWMKVLQVFRLTRFLGPLMKMI